MDNKQSLNIFPKFLQVHPEKWARYNYNITTPLGKDGRRVSGCKKHIEISKNAAAEGMVLLENDGILPLKKGTAVALFGIGSLNYVKGGGGSGEVYCDYIKNIYEGFKAKEPDYKIFDELSYFYYDYAMRKLSEKDEKVIAEPDVPDELIEKAKRNADVAIFTVHRSSGEGYDRTAAKGDFYLTETEENLLKKVTDKFKNVIAVLNVGGMVDVSWIKENPSVKGALLAWQAGMEGGTVIADILCGDTNPSGKLTDTFAKKFSDYPSVDTFNESDGYVKYYEDIYVGYRYFETIPGADKKVVYPFGYGLSYTTFAFSNIAAEKYGSKIKVSVTVKNTGKLAGKEVIQCYVNAPDGKLGKPKYELKAFKKTKPLNPGETQQLTLTFAIADMASYDDLGKLKKSAYILEKGEYKIYVGNCVRNLTLCDYKYTVKEEYKLIKQLTELCAPNSIEKRMLSNGKFEALPSFPVKNYDGFVPEVSVGLSPDTKKPKMFKEVASGEISLDGFLAQIPNEDLLTFAGGYGKRGVSDTCAFSGAENFGVPRLQTADGPAGLRIEPYHGISATAFPCAALLACSFNPDIIYKVGKAGALEVKENGFAFWLTPALNIHRNPLCGRNFEYFSEDPLISGEFAAAKVNGIQSVHIGASAKHFACNNKETNRYYSDSRLSERALREIYLKGFEICVKKSQPYTIMTSYNLINGRRCCESYEQIQGILRDEWGFEGFVTSDWHVPYEPYKSVIAGNDVRMPEGDIEKLKQSYKEGKIKREHLLNNAKHILNVFLKFE